MTTPVDQNRPMPNFWFCYSAFIGFFAWNTWPDEGSHFGWYILAGFLTFVSLVSVRRAWLNLQRDYNRRLTEAKSQRSSGVFGSARFASFVEESAAGLHDPMGFLLLGLSRTVPVYLSLKNLMVQAIPGAGKTSELVCAAIFHALQTGRSCVVSDAKPELVYLWAKELKSRGFNVVFNNPGLLKDWPHHNSNPFQPLIEAVADPDAQAEIFNMAEALARALIPEIKNDKNEFFRSLDRAAFTLVLIYFAGFEPENCYPAQVWQALTDPQRFKDICRVAAQCDALDGDLAALASNFLSKEKLNPEHFDSALAGAANALSVFKNSSTLGIVGSSHEFDPKTLRDENGPPTVVFDIMPADKLSVFGKANALIQTARLQALKRHRKGRDVVFICDEATNLPVPSIVEEIELVRSFGIIICLFYQSWSSLVRVYGEERAESIRASSVEMYFSVGDVKTAEDISKRSGDYTVKSDSQSFDEYGKPSRTTNEAKQTFIPVDDVLSLSREEALVFVPGLRPIKLTKLPWFHVEPFKSLAGENPHERHAKSSITRLILQYGKNAKELGPPVVADLKKRMAFARITGTGRPKMPRVPFLTARSLYWVPIVGSAVAFIYFAGTPHLRFEYEIHSSANAAHRCLYVGLSGWRLITVGGRCPVVKLIRYPVGDEA